MREAADPRVISHRSVFRVWVFAAAFFGALAAGVAAQPANSLLHKQAPEFVLNDLDGKPLDLNAYRGKVVLLNFWATWCAPCQLEMPRFVGWQQRYGAHGFQIVGISMDDDPALARNVARRLKVNYPVAMGDEKMGELYGGILGLPVTFLIDTDGRIAGEFRGETDLGAMEAQVNKLLRMN